LRALIVQYRNIDQWVGKRPGQYNKPGLGKEGREMNERGTYGANQAVNAQNAIRSEALC
jgi:hypothetical protein